MHEAVDVGGPVLDAARRAGAIPGLTLERRRLRLLRSIGPSMGPVQLEHTTLHCEHVARTAARLAGVMRLPPAQVHTVRLSALLHDIGKAMVPEELLARPGPLTPREKDAVGRHAAFGAEIACQLGAPEAIIRGIRAHHIDAAEAPDAPIEARVVRVADAMVVMTTGRAYSPARVFAAALAELRRCRGTQFDPDAVIAAHILGASVMALAA